MPVACFYNFSDFEFTWGWGGEVMTFAPKEKKFMPAFLAQHFAKHLVNRELHRMGLDHETSPKAPEDQPTFYKLFKTAYIRERTLPGGKRNSLVDMVNAVDKNFQEVIAPEIVTAKTNVLAPDAPPVLPPREVAPQEDPSFKRDKGWDSGEGTTAPAGAGQSEKVQVVLPPDFDADDEGYEGVEIQTPAAAPAAPAPAAQAPITT